MAIPPTVDGELRICPPPYITVELPPSKFIALIQPSCCIYLASSPSVRPTECFSRPSAVIIITSPFSVYPIAVRGFLPVIAFSFWAVTSMKTSPSFIKYGPPLIICFTLRQLGSRLIFSSKFFVYCCFTNGRCGLISFLFLTLSPVVTRFALLTYPLRWQATSSPYLNCTQEVGQIYYVL